MSYETENDLVLNYYIQMLHSIEFDKLLFKSVIDNNKTPGISMFLIPFLCVRKPDRTYLLT